MNRRKLLIGFAIVIVTAGALWLAYRGDTAPQAAAGLSEEDKAWLKEWLPKSARLIKVVELLPQERKTIVAPTRDSWMGLQVKQGWDLFERRRIDQKDYGVRLQLVGDQKFMETPLGGSTDFGESKAGEEFELHNDTPIKVTVAVYTENGE